MTMVILRQRYRDIAPPGYVLSNIDTVPLTCLLQSRNGQAETDTGS